MNETQHFLLSLFKKLSIHQVNETINAINESTNNQVFSYGGFIGKISGNPKNLKTEYETLQQLENKGKFPRAFYYGKTDDNQYIILMEKLPGTWLQYSWNKLSDNQKKNIINEIILNLRIIHSLSWTQKSYYNYLKIEWKKLFEICKKNPHLSEAVLIQIYSNFQKNLQSFESTKECIIHNDLWYKNILLEDGKLSGIIDFEMVVSAPKQVELFKLFHHRYSAQNYIDNWAVDYTEIAFLDLLLKTLEKEYPELFSFAQEQYQCYNLYTYLKILSKHNESWYNHKDMEKYHKSFLI